MRFILSFILAFALAVLAVPLRGDASSLAVREGLLTHTPTDLHYTNNQPTKFENFAKREISDPHPASNIKHLVTRQDDGGVGWPLSLLTSSLPGFIYELVKGIMLGLLSAVGGITGISFDLKAIDLEHFATNGANATELEALRRVFASGIVQGIVNATAQASYAAAQAA